MHYLLNIYVLSRQTTSITMLWFGVFWHTIYGL